MSKLAGAKASRPARNKKKKPRVESKNAAVQIMQTRNITKINKKWRRDAPHPTEKEEAVGIRRVYFQNGRAEMALQKLVRKFCSDFLSFRHVKENEGDLHKTENIKKT